MPGIDNYSLDNYGLDGSEFEFSPGGFYLYNGTQLFRSYQTGKKKLISFLMIFPGTYRVEFELTAWRGNEVQVTSYGQIYVDGVPCGIIRSSNSNSYTLFIEDIKVNGGEKIEIWQWQTGANGISYAELANPKIRCQELMIQTAV
ncbi:hypothetical protein ASD24_23145 [Paenibacillus sp. Root52]|uniref:hypothetical protein n=1 Tax=Paenibacillus sp. Root52 TaxID=1736552 RepID=UPI0006F3317B|nr:hypothetical protein [Paenibacillus sp. Root52]KQY91633.1 hypothetical protein ASD24_23145 [Paenibacillus sp. Root52]